MGELLGLAQDGPLGADQLEYLDHGGVVLREFGDFELFEMVGEGGMGQVFRARQVSLNRVVALKLMRTGRETGTEFRARFRQEAELAARLQHPNIVPIFEVGEQDGQPYYAMEWVAGRDLGAVVAGRPLPAPRAAAYVRSIAEAVHYAHRAGVLHRDLKPANILVGEPDDRPRVTDFGLARAMNEDSDLTLPGNPLGTPGYLPPEQISPGTREIGPAADVYGLGAVLYHALTGVPPFSGPTLASVFEQVLTREPISPRTRNPEVPRDLATVCLKCLEKDPTRRYGSAEALARDLDRFLHDEPTLARPPALAERVWRRIRRGRRTLVPVAVLLAILGATLAAMVLQRREHQQESRVEHAASVAAENPLETLHLLAQSLGESPADRIAAEQLVNRINHSAFLVPSGPTFGTNIAWIEAAADGRVLVSSITNAFSSRVEVLDDSGLRWRGAEAAGVVLHAALSSNQRWLAVGTDSGCTVQDRADESGTTFRLPGCPPNVFQVGFLRDSGPGALPGEEVLLTVAAAQALLWVPDPWRIRRQFSLSDDEGYSCAVSPDHARLAVAGERTFAIRVWELSSGRLLLEGTHSNVVRSLAFSPNSEWLVSGSDDGTAALWNVPTGRREGIYSQGQRRVLGTRFLDEVRFVTLEGMGNELGLPDAGARLTLWNRAGAISVLSHPRAASIDWMAFDPSRELLTTLAADRRLRLWDVREGTLLGVAPPGLEISPAVPGVSTPTASRDGSRLFALRAGGRVAPLRWIRGRSRLRPDDSTDDAANDPSDAAKWTESTLAALAGTAVSAHAVSAPSRTLAIATESGTLMLFDSESRRLMSRESRLGVAASVLRFDPEGRRLAVATPTGSLEILDWDRSRGGLTPLLRLSLARGPESLRFARDGRSLRIGFLSRPDEWIPVAHVTARVPAWLPDLAEALAGRSDRFNEVRDRIRRETAGGSGAAVDREWAEWAKATLE